MANLYNSDITTRIIEPVNHSNGRSEFRLENDSCYLSNLSWRKLYRVYKPSRKALK